MEHQGGVAAEELVLRSCGWLLLAGRPGFEGAVAESSLGLEVLLKLSSCEELSLLGP